MNSAWSIAFIIAVALIGALVWLHGERSRVLAEQRLEGGTRLVYGIEIDPETDQRPDAIARRLIEVARDVQDDPRARWVRWRMLDDQRLEVRIPPMPAEVEQRRSAWLEARNAALAGDADEDEADDPALELARLHLMQVLTFAEQAAPDDPQGGSVRQLAIDNLKARFPAHAASFDAAARAWREYEQVRSLADDPAELTRPLRGGGGLAFRIGPHIDEVPDGARHIERLEREGPSAGEQDDFIWREVDIIATGAGLADEMDALVGPVDDETFAAYQERIEKLFRGHHLVVRAWQGRFYMLVSNRPDERLTPAERDWHITRARPITDPWDFPAIRLRLDRAGGRRMQHLSGDGIGRPLAILIDGRVITAPIIRAPLKRNIMVSRSFGFSDAELQYLIRRVQMTMVPARLSDEPQGVTEIDPRPHLPGVQGRLNLAIIGTWVLLGGLIIASGLYMIRGRSEAPVNS